MRLLSDGCCCRRAQYAEERVRRDGLLALDRCAGESVAEMLALVENCEDPEDGEVHLAMFLFPSFTLHFSRMVEADGEFARQSLKHYIETIIGPPNRPTYESDRAGELAEANLLSAPAGLSLCPDPMS